MPSALDLDRPFFARQSTKRAIDELAHLSNLCVFAGAGVAVDRTGLTWDDLTCHLLVKSGMDREDAGRLVASLSPRRAASIAVQLYYDAKGSADWQLALANDLRSVLYDKRDWLGGRISRSLAEIWVEFTNAGKSIEILTTNYDQHIELDIDEAVKIWTQQLEIAGQPVPRAFSQSKGVKYLHGSIPRNGVIHEYPVVSERDYFETNAAAENQIAEAAERNNMLIIGSGLNDPPLLNALLRTRQKAEDDHLKRIALVPRADLNAIDASDQSDFMIENYQKRLNHFGIEGVFVDHYAQIGQMLAEVRIASALSEHEYPGSTKRYSGRLRNWWDNWYARIATPDGVRAIQRDHHEALATCLQEIKSLLKVQDEELKLEMWLRWLPSETHRELRLWASSFASFESWNQTRAEDIKDDARHASVRAFCAGRACYTSNPDPAERWTTYIALPLEAGGEVGLVVGSIVIASMTAEGHSCLSESNRGQHVNALLGATELGARLASAG